MVAPRRVPRDRTRDVARVFDDWAKAGRDEGMAERHLITARPALEALELGPGVRLLDLGTGNGWAARYAIEQGAQAVGVDVARRMLVKARRLDPRVRLLQADLTALPFADDSFGAGFSMEALYYADDVERALAEAARVLAPGARLDALIDYYEENEASHGWPEKTGVSMTLVDEAGWGELFERAGFTDVGTDRVRSDADVTADWKAEHGSLHIRGIVPG